MLFREMKEKISRFQILPRFARSSSEILDMSESSSNSHLAPEIEDLQSLTNFVLNSKENLEIARLKKLLATTIKLLAFEGPIP